jgi:hypothetical protein
MAKGTFRGLREPDPDEPFRIHIVLPDVPVESHPESRRVEPNERTERLPVDDESES